MRGKSVNLSYNHLRTPKKTPLFSNKSRPNTANRVLPEVYHGSTLLHRTPSRHADISLLAYNSSKKSNFTRVESAILSPEGLSRQIKVKKAPVLKQTRRIPMTKAEGEMILFREIFVKPKEEKLEQLKQLMHDENFNDLLFNQKKAVKAVHVEPEVEKEFLKSLPEHASFYDHQIEVQPPEGLNATIAAPLTPGGGWAPSIPPSIASIRNNSLKDVTLRAKSGMQAGDVQREAHMAYSLAVLNEADFQYEEALKFYKRFFFCAKMLDDPIGAALALNRIGTMYFNLGKLEKSISFHLKHAEFSDKENKFAAFYNLGIAFRHQKDGKEAIKVLTKALGWANKRMDLESQCITLGQLGLAFSLLKEYKNAVYNLENALNFAKTLKNEELQLETCLALGALNYEHENWTVSSKYYSKALGLSKVLSMPHVTDICSCNLGIVEANKNYLEMQNLVIERCKSHKNFN